MREDRCEGAITEESLTMRDPSVIGCYDSERIKQYYNYLHEQEEIESPPARHDSLTLPSFIPVLISGMPHGIEFPPDRLYGVYLKTLLNDNGSPRYATPGSLRKGLQLPPEARLALFQTATDILIEKAWILSEVRYLWERIFSLNFEFVTSTTYSVYEDNPRSDQIYNQERNFRTHDIFCSLGVPCIPFLFFNPQSQRDYDSIIKWLGTRRDVTKVAMLAHCYRGKTAFARMISHMKTIVKDVERPLEFVLVGAATLDKIRLMREFPNTTFATKQPVFKGTYRQRILPDLRPDEVRVTDVSKAQLVVENIEQFDRAIDTMKPTDGLM